MKVARSWCKLWRLMHANYITQAMRKRITTPRARIAVVHQAGERGVAFCLLVSSRGKLNSPSEHQ